MEISEAQSWTSSGSVSYHPERLDEGQHGGMSLHQPIDSSQRFPVRGKSIGAARNKPVLHSGHRLARLQISGSNVGIRLKMLVALPILSLGMVSMLSAIR